MLDLIFTLIETKCHTSSLKLVELGRPGGLQKKKKEVKVGTNYRIVRQSPRKRINP